MEYVRLGSTGLKVSRLCLGCMGFGDAQRWVHQWVLNEEQSRPVIQKALELGINFFDTANVYCLDDGDLGHNERLIGKALAGLGLKGQILVATKGGLRRPKGGWVVDGSPVWLRASCERSLKDLGVEVIDLYQLHAVDGKLGLMPSLETLVRLQEEGKIRHIGLSNVHLAQVQEAMRHVPVVAVQNRCNPFEKEDFSNGLADYCRQQQITYIAHSPVGGHHDHLRLKRGGILPKLAEKYRSTPYCVVLAWLLAKGPHVLPIPGASKISSVESSLSAMELSLEEGDLR